MTAERAAGDTEITTRWIAEKGEGLFTHSASYHAHVPIAGRRREMLELTDVVTGHGRRVALLSGNLGAGKTFLLERLFNELTKDDDTPFNEATQVVNVQANSAVKDSYGFERESGNVLVVEELDRKVPSERLFMAVEAAVGWLEVQKDAALILTGDRFLEHPDISEILDRVDAERTVVSMDDLDEQLLGDALRLRIQWKLGYTGREPLPRAVHAAERLLAEPLVRNGLLPPTDEPVATFRDALAGLDGLRRDLELVDEPCTLPVRSLAAFRDSALPARGLRRELEEAVLAEIIRRARSREQFPPLSVADLIGLVRDGSGEDEDYHEENYRPDVVEPLSQSGVLLPIGIPYADGPRARIAGPFLPTTRSFLRAFSRLVEGLGGDERLADGAG